MAEIISNEDQPRNELLSRLLHAYGDKKLLKHLVSKRFEQAQEGELERAKNPTAKGNYLEIRSKGSWDRELQRVLDDIDLLWPNQHEQLFVTTRAVEAILNTRKDCIIGKRGANKAYLVRHKSDGDIWRYRLDYLIAQVMKLPVQRGDLDAPTATFDFAKHCLPDTRVRNGLFTSENNPSTKKKRQEPSTPGDDDAA